MSRLKLWKRFLADRWQLPLAFVALGVATATVLNLRPDPPATPFEALRSDVEALVAAGRFQDAVDAAANLLDMEPPLTRSQRGILHDLLADTLLEQERRREVAIPANVDLLLKHHETAILLGAPADAEAALRAARAYEWQDRREPAINEYRAALERAETTDERRQALASLVRLLKGDPDGQDERRAFIDRLLLEDGVSAALAWETLREALQDAIERDELERAAQLLESQGRQLQRDDLRGYLDFLHAWLNLAQGRHAQALAYLDAVDAWWAERSPDDPELDRSAYLPAYAAWLRGRIELSDGRPQAALEHFDRALALQSFGEAFILTALGSAEALARLERHAAARELARGALSQVAGDELGHVGGRERLRRGLIALAGDRHERGDHAHAIAYLTLALEFADPPERALRLDLHEQLGLEHELAAKDAGDGQQPLLLGSAGHYEAAANLATLDAPRYSTLLWRAAIQYDAAGALAASRRVLADFVGSREDDPRLPRAMLQLGQAYAADGRLNEAINWYDELIGLYPRLTEGAQARLLKAESLELLGEQNYPTAERELLELVDGDLVGPAAPVYRDAMFALADMYYHTGLYAEAISRIEDLLSLYPDDADRGRLGFMLADAFRRSAHALRSQPDADERALATADERLLRAAALFGEVLATGWGADPDADFYRRLALLYRGDCLYDLNRPETLGEALATYYQAASEYRGAPAALTAHVQIANIHLRSGRLREAASSLERARWQLATIPDQAFGDSGAMDRAGWERLLATAADAPMLRDLRADQP